MIDMKKKPVKIKICSSEEESWDTIWKWSWFTKELWISELWEEEKIALKPVFTLLSKWRIKSILDCSCGLGFKLVLFAKKGFEVEGSDASVIAIKHAPQLAKDEGVRIKFFHSSYEGLSKKCKRKYDCVYSDYFDETAEFKVLRKSAKGIFSVLKKGGKFIFCGALPKWTKNDLQKVIEREWKKRKKFDILPAYEKDGVRMTSIEVDEKIPEGILENRIFLIEKQGVMRVEIAFMMNSRIKWTFKDYNNVLKGAGFRKVECIKTDGQILNIGIK